MELLSSWLQKLRFRGLETPSRSHSSSVERPREMGRKRPGFLGAVVMKSLTVKTQQGAAQGHDPWLWPCADFHDLKAVALRR